MSSPAHRTDHFKMQGLDQAQLKYLVVIEKGDTSYEAYVPDLPGCAVVGESRDEVVKLIPEAIEFHIEGLKSAGESVPPSTPQSEFVDIHAA